MSRITETPPGKTSRVHPTAVLVGGRNGLPIDSIATVEPGSSFLKNTTTPVSYVAPTVTFDASIDLSPLQHFTKKFTGVLIFTDSTNTSYFIDPLSINNTTHTLNIYMDTSFSLSPSSVGLVKGWILSEAELVNRLATSTSAIIDQVNFEGVDVSLQLSSKEDSVQVIGPSGNALDPNADGSINTKITSSVLPTGAATSAKQDIGNASLAEIALDTDHLDANLSTLATSAKQDTGNASLASIDGKLVDNFGVATAAVRTAAQVGNPTGAADFNSGVTGAQTLRTSANQGAPNTIGNAWPIKVTDGTNTQAVKAASTIAAVTDPAAVMALTPNRPVTYSASIFNATLPVSFLGLVGYFFSLQGSATKTIRITRISLSGTETTTGQHVFTAYVATSVAGGTATPVNAVPHDFSSSAATAVPVAWESGATPGGIGVLLLRSWTLFMPAVTGNVAGTQINERFGYGPSQEIILRGTSQFFTFAIQGVAPAGALMNAYIEWTEE